MTAPKSTTISPLAWMLLIILGLLWGGSFFFARFAIGHVPPLTLAFLRFILAAIALHLFIAGRYSIYKELLARWRSFALLGLINNVIPHSFIFIGQTEIGAGLASIINATTPIWTVLVAHALTSDEKLTPAKAFGTLTGLAGTVLLFLPHIGEKAGAPLWALLLPLLAAVSYGFAAIFGRRFRSIPAPVTAAGQLTFSSIIMAPVALAHDLPWTLPIPPFSVIAAVLALAFASTALGYILYFRLITLAGATNTSLVTLLVPPSAILLGVLFLGEQLDLFEGLGLLAIAFGLVILDGRLVSRLASSLKR
jgi:drug/metabolite transporter (DMT)-like permease